MHAGLRLLSFLVFLSTLHAAPRVVAQTIWHVRPGGSGNNTGLSWSHAFADLQSGLNAAIAGDQVWVAGGTYRPTLLNDRNATFTLKSGVALYGGFSGGELSVEERSWELHPSILDGDIGIPGDPQDNTYNLMRMANPNAATRVDGFIFQYAHANKSGVGNGNVGASGAALFIESSSSARPEIRNSIFRFNTAVKGGGAVYIKTGSSGQSEPRFLHCQFIGNVGDHGGAVYKQGSSSTETATDFDHCTFKGNQSNTYGSAISFIDADNRTDTLDIRHCVFENNTANLGINLPAGAVYCSGRLNGSCLRFFGTTFLNNGSRSGSGIVFYSDIHPLRYLQVDSCHFEGNYTTQWNQSVAGLALSVYSGFYDLGVMKTRCLLTGNTFIGHNGPIIEIAMLANNHTRLEGNLLANNSNYQPGYGGGFALQSDTIEVWHNRFSDNAGVRFGFTASVAFTGVGNIFRRGSWNVSQPQLPVRILQNVFDGRGAENSFQHVPTGLYFGNLVLNNRFEIPTLDPPPPHKKTIYQNNLFINNRNIRTDNPGLSYLYLPFYHDSAYFDYNLFDFDESFLQSGKAVWGQGNLYGQAAMLADTAIGDYRLLPCSPAYNAGSASPYIAYGLGHDLAGNPRVVDGIPDMGPLETPSMALLAVETGADCGESTGSFLVEAVHACPPLTYNWVLNGSAGTGRELLAAGNYQVTVTDGRGRQLPANISIAESEAPVVQAGIIPATCPACADGSIQIDLQNPGAYLPGWSNGTGFLNLTAVTAGDYALTLTDAGGCSYVFNFTVPFTSGVRPSDAVGMEVFPNPARESLTVLMTPDAPFSLYLFDLPGRKVLERSGLFSGASTDIAALAPGWYVWVVRTTDGRRHSGRLYVGVP
jgi:hypothetical protein